MEEELPAQATHTSVLYPITDTKTVIFWVEQIQNTDYDVSAHPRTYTISDLEV